MKKGDTVKGHFCYECLRWMHMVLSPTKDNPRKTDWCIACNHRREGLNASGIIGDWLITHPAGNPELEKV